jgi:hypothetical protein
MYSYSGLTQSARLLGSVQGVLVHANKNVLGSSLHSNDTTIDGSFTSCSNSVRCAQLCDTLSSAVLVLHVVTLVEALRTAACVITACDFHRWTSSAASHSTKIACLIVDRGTVS